MSERLTGKETPSVSTDKLTERSLEVLGKLKATADAQREKIAATGKLELEVAMFQEFGSCFMDALYLSLSCMEEMGKLEKILRQVSGEYDMLAYLSEHKEALEKLLGGEA